MITCAACKITKNPDEFFNNAVKLNRKDSKCKSCRTARSKAWAEANAGRHKEARKDYYNENKESILAYKHEYYRENREKILAGKTEYWHKNKDQIRSRVKLWREENKQVSQEKSKRRRDYTIKAVLELLGPSCKSCNETELELLTVDHLDNDGYTDRKNRPALGWKRDIINGKSDVKRFQVLCHNCNSVKYNLNPVHHLKPRIPTGVPKKCIHCEYVKDLSDFKSQESNDRSICLDCARNRRKRTNNDRKKILGNKCACCGILDLDFLVVDHVKSDGNVLRRNGQRTGEGLLYEATIGGVANLDYQLLCYNCNYSKHIGNGVCVHSRTKKPKALPKAHIKPKVSISVDLINFSFKDVIISATIDYSESKLFLDKHHYAGFGRGATNVYEVRLIGELIGVVKFSTPVRQGIAGTLDVRPDELLELDRFCIHPARHKHNFATYIMSRVIKMISNDSPGIKKLVSFADPRFGHSGCIYKASNWEYLGKTAPSYYYEDPNGNEVNKKTLYGYARTRKMKERECFESLGYKRVRTPAKHKYSYTLR